VFVTFQKLMNVLDVHIKTMKIIVEFNKLKSVEAISSKKERKKYIKKQVNCEGI